MRAIFDYVAKKLKKLEESKPRDSPKLYASQYITERIQFD